ncbi:hypothetical protein M1615_01475 [Patescibacteria group bacterium]|nr:hypothetical protein [Patescibacteria group bacterium]MCL5010257.1 hypothetical protein [Patescibacteria group bacterium]
MSDFRFLENPLTKNWVILAPRRAKRPNAALGREPVCPFCPGREGDEEELYRVPNSENSVNQSIRRSDKKEADWLVRVVPNKYPFASIHEIIIHSPNHHKNFGDLSLGQTELIFQTYRQRYNTHKDKGQVYIFHNHGGGGGESLPHPHSQLTVVPKEVKMDMPRLYPYLSFGYTLKPFDLRSKKGGVEKELMVENSRFYLFCPQTSQWPDEVWVSPKKRGLTFGEITDGQITDLVAILLRLVKIMDLRHGHEFPFNFYIYPGKDWYLRLIPRVKMLGGFEIGTGIFVNTQDPNETIAFIKEHFENPDIEKIKREQQADYEKRV